jgi:hypothetical protein
VPQNTALCATMLHICRMRITRLNADGTIAAGPSNSIVTDSIIDLAWNPVILAGDERDLTGGCDCLLATFRGRDKHKRFDLTLHNGKLEFAALEMMTGSPVIMDTSTIPTPVGVQFPTNNVIGCSVARPFVAIEAWAEMWDGQAPPANAAFQFARVVFPMSEWRWDNNTMQNDYQPTALAGFTRSNPNWHDPYSDMPFGRTIGAGGGIILDDGMPAATCGYSAIAAS